MPCSNCMFWQPTEYEEIREPHIRGQSFKVEHRLCTWTDQDVEAMKILARAPTWLFKASGGGMLTSAHDGVNCPAWQNAYPKRYT